MVKQSRTRKGHGVFLVLSLLGHSPAVAHPDGGLIVGAGLTFVVVMAIVSYGFRAMYLVRQHAEHWWLSLGLLGIGEIVFALVMVVLVHSQSLLFGVLTIASTSSFAVLVSRKLGSPIAGPTNWVLVVILGASFPAQLFGMYLFFL